ncbi:MAG: lipoprotein BA_5634 family protein, partial [Clostridium sp.]
DSFEDVREEKIGNKKIKVRYGFYGWLGLHPQEAKIILVDDKTYNSIDGEIKEVSVIRFNKNKYDLREKDDQGKIKEELKGLTDNIKIGYINLED